MYPAARDTNFQTENISIIILLLQQLAVWMFGTVWRWAWFHCFIMWKPVVFQMKHVSFFKGFISRSQ